MLHARLLVHATQSNYASKLGLSQTEKSMRTSLEEAKQEDQQYTALAEKMLATNS